ncbi:MAG: hypothetical protein RJA81_948 [Planctomycetota bacterium]
MPIIPSQTLTDFVKSLFIASGVPETSARVVAESLVGANLCGHDSHGVLRIPQYIDFIRTGAYNPSAELRIESDSGAVTVADGGWGLGQVQSHRLLDHIIPKARQFGLASGAGRQFGHIGRLGEYTERVAGEGMILLCTVNNCGAGQRVAPPGGTEPRLGTNPLCMGVPTGREPVVLDFGTSVVAEGKVRSYFMNDRKPVPEGWLLDPQGEPTTDSSVLYEKPLGSILPMGGPQAYKGFGLAFVLDILAGGLTGGHSAYPGAPPAKGNNVFFLIIQPTFFAGADHLLNQALGLSEYVRSSHRREGVDEILLPGDPEIRNRSKRNADGIPMESAHWSKLKEIADSLNVVPPNIDEAS